LYLFSFQTDYVDTVKAVFATSGFTTVWSTCRRVLY